MTDANPRGKVSRLSLLELIPPFEQEYAYRRPEQFPAQSKALHRSASIAPLSPKVDALVLASTEPEDERIIRDRLAGSRHDDKGVKS